MPEKASVRAEAVEQLIGRLVLELTSHRDIQRVQQEIQTLTQRGQLSETEADEVRRAMRAPYLALMFGVSPRTERPESCEATQGVPDHNSGPGGSKMATRRKQQVTGVRPLAGAIPAGGGKKKVNP